MLRFGGLVSSCASVAIACQGIVVAIDLEKFEPLIIFLLLCASCLRKVLPRFMLEIHVRRVCNAISR